MELHPFLEKNQTPNPDLWYVLSAFGDCPSMRVGHTCSYVPSSGGYGGKIYVIGGANPSGPFAETYCLDLETFTWEICDSMRLKPRYEHSAFIPQSQPTKVYIFGGADQGGNHNDIQVFDTTTKSWSILSAGGTVPSPRTYHMTACVGDRFIVYSGGQSGSDPVGDRQVHCFDATTQAWSTLNVRGDSPKPRHGHTMAAIGNKIYIHGGMSGTTFYDDLHVLDLSKNTWTSVKQKKVYPCGRAAHGSFVLDKDLYVFGGMNRDGALDDMYKLNTETMKWVKVNLEGPPPACRLDFASCVLRLRVPLTPHASSEEVVDTSAQAIEILGQQLRMGSAGSVRSMGSVGSAGSVRSVGSLGSAGSQRGEIEVLSTDYHNASPSHSPSRHSCGSGDIPSSPVTVQGIPIPGAAISGPVPMATPPQRDSLLNSNPADSPRQYKTVDLALVLGGMDTDGEIFEDCLVYLLKETPDLGAEGEPDRLGGACA